MNRTKTVILLRGLAVVLPALAIVSGCAGRKPVAEMARAEQAVRHAQTTSEAQRYAPVELSAAQDKLAAARRALDDNEYDDARRLAEQALADAQLAEAKAESQLAREQASRTRQDIQALQAEALAPDTVVIDRQKTVQVTTPAVRIVERVTPASTVVVERTTTAPATTVVVERPVQSVTVIEREPSVVVVPE